MASDIRRNVRDPREKEGRRIANDFRSKKNRAALQELVEILFDIARRNPDGK